jgi:hypothetical protein
LLYESLNYTPWKSVYSNLTNHVLIDPPVNSHHALVYEIRIRAKNQYGWSSYSNMLRMNFRIYPSLFPTGFVVFNEFLKKIDAFYFTNDTIKKPATDHRKPNGKCRFKHNEFQLHLLCRLDSNLKLEFE